jgi:hypothetical protein
MRCPEPRLLFILSLTAASALAGLAGTLVAALTRELAWPDRLLIWPSASDWIDSASTALCGFSASFSAALFRPAWLRFPACALVALLLLLAFDSLHSRIRGFGPTDPLDLLRSDRPWRIYLGACALSALVLTLLYLLRGYLTGAPCSSRELLPPFVGFALCSSILWSILFASGPEFPHFHWIYDPPQSSKAVTLAAFWAAHFSGFWLIRRLDLRFAPRLLSPEERRG